MKRLSLTVLLLGLLVYSATAASADESHLAAVLRQRLIAATEQGQIHEKQFGESLNPLLTGARFSLSQLTEAHDKAQHALDGYLAVLEDIAKLSTPEAKAFAATALDAVIWQKEIYTQMHGELCDLVYATRLAKPEARDQAELIVLFAAERIEDALPRFSEAIAKDFRAFAIRYRL